jgi:hypothetical protein
MVTPSVVQQMLAPAGVATDSAINCADAGGSG